MSPSVAQWSSGSAYAPASISVSWPNAPAAGDLLVVAFWNNGQSTASANTYTAPAGWTLVNQNTAHSYATYQLFSHVVVAGEANAYAFTPQAAQRQHVWIAADLVNASAIDTSANAWIANSTAFTTPTVTPAQAGETAIALNMPLTTSVLTWSNPSGWSAGAGPTTTWSGEALSAALSSTAAVFASSSSSVAASGFSAIALVSPSGAQPTPSPSTSPVASPTSGTTGGAPTVAQWTNSSAYAPSSITVTWPNAPIAGDLLVVSFLNNGQSSGAANTYTPPAGWTLVDQNVSQSYMTYQTFTHIAGAGEANAYAFRPLSPARQHVWIGADMRGGSGIDKAGNAFVSNGTSYTTPTLTPSQGSDLAVTFNFSIAGSGAAWTNPAGWTFGSGPTSPWQGESITRALSSAAPASATSVLSSPASGFCALVLVAPSGAASTATPVPTPTPAPTVTPAPTPAGGGGGGAAPKQWMNGSAYAPASITATWPSAPAIGDVLVIAFWNNGQTSGSANTYTAPAGWNLIDQNTASYATYQAYAHVVGPGENNAYVFTPLSPVRQHVWIGTDTAGVSGVDKGGDRYVSGSTSFTTTSLSPSQSGDLAIALNLSITSNSVTWSNAPGWTLGSGPTSTWRGEAVYQTLSSTAPAAQTATVSLASSGFAALILLSPSGGGTAPPPTPTPAPTPTASSGVDWSTFGYDLQRTGFNPSEKIIGTGSFGTMHSAWAALPNVGGFMQGEPVLAMNVNVGGSAMNLLYAGGQGGTFYAINADTGAVVWSKSLGTETYVCDGSTFNWGIAGAGALDRVRNRVYVPDGQNRLHALDLASGAEAAGWPVSIAAVTHNDGIHVSMNYNPNNGFLYAATSTHCDISPWFGRITAINTATAGIVNTFYPTQNTSGGGIWGWGGASIDPSSNNVFIAVGNADEAVQQQNAFYAEQIVELSPDLSTVIDHNYPTSLPPMDDEDFGATPLLFQPIGCPPLLAAMNKSGALVLYNRTNLAAGPIQTVIMSLADGIARFRGLPAYSPVTNEIYVELPVNFGIYQEGVGAFSMNASCTLNTTPVWNAVFGNNGDIRSPITLANGVLYISGYTDRTTYAFDASTGSKLWSASLSGSGIVGPIVANGRIYVGDEGGTIRAWQP